MVFVQGQKPSGNILTAVMSVDPSSTFYRSGAVFESTSEGATVFRFAFINANQHTDVRQR